MSMKLVKRVPTGEEIKELYPLSQELKDIKAKRDEEEKVNPKLTSDLYL